MNDNLNCRILTVPTNNDKVYRDSLCMAYACSVLDLSMSDFESGVGNIIKKNDDVDALIELLHQDLEVRIKRLLGYKYGTE